MQRTSNRRVCDVARSGRIVRNAIGIMAASFCLIAGTPITASAAPAQERATPKVYMLRGLMNIFSLGLDDLALQLQQRGIRTDVSNHTLWGLDASEAIADYKAGRTRPIILIGHSAGANAVIDMVEALGQAGVPVALAITLDTSSRTVPSGTVNNFYNLYVTRGAFSAGKAFHGRLVNIDLDKQGVDVNHFTIEKSATVQKMMLGYIAQAIGGSRHAAPRATEPKSTTGPGNSGQHASVASPAR